MTNHSIMPALAALALLTISLLSAEPALASGQYVHVFTADRAINKIEDSELRGILEDHRAVYKFGSLFPDSYGYDLINPANAADVSGTMHSPEFLNSYAQAINQECFTGPIGETTCQARSDISCNPLSPADCLVGGRYCSETGGQCTTALDCNGLTNVCLKRGVCTSNYRQACGIANIPTNCPGAQNICSTSYGLCLENTITPRCERLISHFMGSLAHIVTDINFDKFFVSTVAEVDSCPTALPDYYNEEDFPRLYADGNPSVVGLAQQHTDQDLDAHLATNASVDGGRDLASYLPGLLSDGRDEVEDTFLILQVLAPITDGILSLSLILDLQWAAIDNKVDDEGDIFVFDGENWIQSGYVPPDVSACPWSTEDEHWRTEAGGTSDSAEEIAEIADRAWVYMRDHRRRPVFEKSGRAPDPHLCVGSSTGPSCLDEKSAEILDAP